MRTTFSTIRTFVTVVTISTAFTIIAEPIGAQDSSETPIVNVPDKFILDYSTFEEIETPEPETPESTEAESTKTEEYTSEPFAKDVPEAKQCVKMELLKVKNWPEFKTGTGKKCWKTPFGKKCVNYPRLYQRNCELLVYAEICHPKANSIRNDIIDCARQAVAAGVIAGVYTGNLAVATESLKAYLVTCLSTKGTKRLDQISVKLRTETKCGSWKPR